MPCLCGGPTESDREISHQNNRINKLQEEKNNLEAALCVALTYIETIDNESLNDFVIMTDWTESGITSKQVESWWKSHKEKDRLRLEREAKALARKQEFEKQQDLLNKKKSEALSKLTAEDMKVLGIS